MGNESTNYREYLLGSLPEKDAEDLDLTIIADPVLEDELLLAESELMEDYLEGSLSSEELELFHQNFLTSTDRKDRVRELAVLKQYSRESARILDINPSSLPDKFKNSRFGFLGLWLRPSYAALSFLIVVIVVVGWWTLFRNGVKLPQQELVALNKQDLSDTSKYQGFSNISLVPGTFRDSATARRLTQANLTETAFFRMEVPSGDLPIYRVELLKGGTKIFTIDEAQVYQNPAGREVRLLLLRSMLSKGQYQIRLEDPGNPGLTLTYAFAVE